MQVLRQHRYAAQCSGAVVTTCAAVSTIQKHQHCRAAQCNLSSYEEVHQPEQQLLQQRVTVGQQQAQRLDSPSHIQSQHRQDLSVWPGLSAWRSKGVDLGRGWGENRADPSIPAAAAGAAEAELIPLPGSLVDVALLVLNTADPNLKAALAHRGWKAYSAGEICLHPEDAAAAAGATSSGSSRQYSTCHPTAARSSFLQPQQQHVQHQELVNPTREQHQQQLCQQQCHGPPDRPARPSKPELVVPKLVPSPKDSQLPLSAHLLHNLAHIELNAIDLALDTVVRFSHLRLPGGFYEDFARVADDEARHFGWCVQRMAELGHRYGDMVAHDLLWEGAQASAGNLAARLAIVPMSQEARGLDAGQRLAARLVGAGDARSASIVSKIAEEERAHVAVGVEWFGRVCVALGVDPPSAFRAWVSSLGPELLKGPFNHQERQLVGLQRAYYDVASWPEELQQQVVQPALAAAAKGKGLKMPPVQQSGAPPEQQSSAPPGQQQPPLLGPQETRGSPVDQQTHGDKQEGSRHGGSTAAGGGWQELLQLSSVPTAGPELQQLRQRLWEMLEGEVDMCRV